MKLSELIFETQILLEDNFEIRKTPNGRFWGVYNTTVTPNVLISSHKTKNQANIKADQLRNPRPAPAPNANDNDSGKRRRGGGGRSPVAPTPTPTVDSPNVKLKPGMFQSGAGKWTIILPDGMNYVDVTNVDDANKLNRHIQTLTEQGKTPTQISYEFQRNRGGFLAAADVNGENVKTVRKNPVTRTIKKLSLDRFESDIDVRKSTKITSWINKPGYQGLKRFATVGLTGIAMNSLFMVLGIALALHQIELEKQEPGANITDLQEEENILRGQMILYVGMFLVYALKDLKLIKKIIGPFRTGLRTAIQGLGMIAGGAAGAVGGSVVGPAGTAAGGAAGAIRGQRAGRLLGILAGEASSYVVLALLAIPQVQRFVASLFQGWWFGDLLEFAGSQINVLLQQADEALDGRFGTGFLADKLGTDEIKREGPDGEYYSDSEWAKLVFGTLMFPDGDSTKFVPFMPEMKREDLMNNLLMPQTPQQTADTAIDNKMNSDNAATQTPDTEPVA